MKIYIPTFNNTHLLKKMEEFKKKLILDEHKEIINVYSEQGIYEVDSKNIYKYDTIFDCQMKEKIVFNYDETYELLLDKSHTNKIIVNYLPFSHNIIKTLFNSFIIDNNNKKYQIKLCICYNVHLTTNASDTYFYFDIPDNVDLHNISIKQDINVFLSHLN